MDVAAYLQRFSGIQVSLNVSSLVEAAPPFSCIEINLSDAAHRLWAPWYANSLGQKRDFHHADAIPASMAMVVNTPDMLLQHGVGAVYIGHAKNLELPVYALPNDNYLLLDGNHRVAAALRDGRQFTATLFVVHGPIDAAVLPDLKHWEPNNAFKQNPLRGPA